MANRIDITFGKLREAREIALIPYVTVGFPSVETTIDLVLRLAQGDADVIELGVPFSDPLADGATIQRASFHALKQGVTLGTCLLVVNQLRKAGVDTPLVLMGYYNPILRYGLEPFAEAASSAGVDGLIVADLPHEEAAPLRKACDARNIFIIPLLAPTSTDERIAQACQRARGFIYCISLTGVTGARRDLALGVPQLIQRVRGHTGLPVAVGFGVSKREHIDIISTYADGAVVGSALIDIIETSPPDGMLDMAQGFLRDLKGDGHPGPRR
ncbi:MAG: tryptophan synthase subunit alpha [Chloroflexi bacterium]|nr:tryptophan synthase subunit alpha [Chloroflexota bacterium]